QVNAFDVTVAGQRPRTEVSRVPLSRKEIESVPGTFGDPLNVVPNLPGVARAPFASGEIVVRGSDTDDSGALVEGGPILSVFHFGGIRSVIPAGMLEGVDFYPGNFSARYGQRTGGILNVRLRDLRPEAVHGYVDVNLFDAGFYVETPVGEKGAVAVAGRRSYIDVVLNAVVDDDAINIISAPRYYDGQILATWRPNPDHTLRLFVLGTDDRFELVSNNIKDSDPRASSGRFRSQESFQMTSLTDTYTPNARLTQKLLVGGSIYGGDADFGGLFITSSLYEGFAREVLSYRAHPAMTLHVGGDALVAFGRLNARIGDLGGEGQPGSTPQDNVRDIKGSQWFRSGGLFAELELRPWTRLLIVPGVRADVQRWNEELTFDPRLTTRLTLTPTVTAKAGVGLYQQSPEVAEVFDQFGNPDLRSERAVHTSAGLEWQPLPFLTLDATAFHKALDRLVVPSDAVVERNGQVEPLRFDNSGKGRVVGAEFLLRQRLAYGLMGWVSYTISRSERFNPETGRYRLFDIDQTHVLTVVGSYQLPWNLELGVRYRMASGNPETPVAGAALDADQDQYLPLYGPLNSARKPMFHQLDLRLDKHWVFNTWRLTICLYTLCMHPTMCHLLRTSTKRPGAIHGHASTTRPPPRWPSPPSAQTQHMGVHTPNGHPLRPSIKRSRPSWQRAASIQNAAFTPRAGMIGRP
ncbi:MAG: TonB-dependent receptor, partial [Myxococcota bacterium]